MPNRRTYYSETRHKYLAEVHRLHALDLTKSQIADRLGLSRYTVSEWLKLPDPAKHPKYDAGTNSWHG